MDTQKPVNSTEKEDEIIASKESQIKAFKIPFKE